MKHLYLEFYLLAPVGGDQTNVFLMEYVRK